MFKHKNLANAIEAKFKDNPGLKDGVSTRNGELIKWPDSLGPFPTDVQLQQWVDEYEQLPADDAAKDPRANRLKRIRAANNLADIKAILEELV